MNGNGAKWLYFRTNEYIERKGSVKGIFLTRPLPHGEGRGLGTKSPRGTSGSARELCRKSTQFDIECQKNCLHNFFM